MGHLESYCPAKQWKEQGAGCEYRYDYLGRLIEEVSPEKEHRLVERNFDGKITRRIHLSGYERKK